MARFLNDQQVGASIRKVMEGENVRCAVAFWGNGASKTLFASQRANCARIVCDLTMGGTNPGELEQLGAPTNANLKHVEGLHAKFYLSNLGLVVASANASNRGIGFVEIAALIECGTLHEAGSKAFRDAEEWFEQLWGKSRAVDLRALDSAKRAWARRPRHGTPDAGVLPGSPNSLLRRIAFDAETYRGIGVVFTSGAADNDDVNNAVDAAIVIDDALPKPKLSHDKRAKLRAWDEADLFTEWSDAAVNAWPKKFLCAHRGPRGAVTYWCYERVADVCLSSDNCSVFAAQSEPLRAQLGIQGKPRQAAIPEDELLHKIFDHLDSHAIDGIGHRLCESSAHLARLLEDICVAV